MPTARIPGITLRLADGDYVVPPLSLGALEQLQSQIASFTGNVLDAGQVATVIDATHAALRRNYPDLTRDAVAELIDVGNMVEVFEALMDVSGLKRKAQESAPGEALPGR